MKSHFEANKQTKPLKEIWEMLRTLERY